MRRFIALIMLLSPVIASAQDELPPNLEALPQVDVPPRSVQDQQDDDGQPEITITRSDKKIIQEFRRSGRLYMIKIVPDIGPPYYFLDTNGDGTLDVRSSDDLDRGSRVNLWKLLEWNW